MALMIGATHHLCFVEIKPDLRNDQVEVAL
jgi:hypothetical protein